jgi:hypothetical protein
VVDVSVGVRPRSRFLEPLAPALPLVVPGLGLDWVLVWSWFDLGLEDGSEDLLCFGRSRGLFALLYI